eukprot:SAG31_NODE_7630_length_1635_cov_2.006510_2_plen_79_part_00
MLAEWEEGLFANLSPKFGLPLGGLIQCIDWSRRKGESLQAELIGMTSVTEVNRDYVTKYHLLPSDRNATRATDEEDDP